jgi:hypothetical protein
MIRRGDLDGRPWEGRAARSSRSQQGTGPRSHPQRATMKDSVSECDICAIVATFWPHPGRGQAIAPTMDGPGKSIRRHSRGAPLWSPCCGRLTISPSAFPMSFANRV